MKRALLTLCLAWALPARADTTLPQPGTAKSWADSCAARIDATAKRLGLKPGARISLYPLVHEDGTPNPVHYVEWAVDTVAVQVGDDAELHEDLPWRKAPPITFRRLNHRFGKIYSRTDNAAATLQATVDECLRMGDAK